MVAMHVSLPVEEGKKLTKLSPPKTNATGDQTVQKPDPTAVAAKTAADHHDKAERLGRINEEIQNLEVSPATDNHAEGGIRRSLAEKQRKITEYEQKRDEINKIILQEQKVIELGKRKIETLKDQRRQHFSGRMKELIELQTEVFIEVKQAERTLHAELTQKIQGYELNAVPKGQSSLIKRGYGADSLAVEVPSSDEDEDSESKGEPSSAPSAKKVTTNGPATTSKAASVELDRVKKRGGEVAVDKAKRVCREAPRNSEEERFAGFFTNFM
jgi:hypothetical protein